MAIILTARHSEIGVVAGGNMNLYIDLGNTNFFMGVYKENALQATFRTATDLNKSVDEYAAIIAGFFRDRNIDTKSIKSIWIASVVPSLNRLVTHSLENIFTCPINFVASGVKTGFSIRVDSPNEVGADLICVAVGASSKHGYPLLIVDLGTASKITVVDNKCAFVGGVFMTGLRVSMQALAASTANLPEISLDKPKNIIGKNTLDSMNSGAINGHIEMIKGLCNKIEEELGYPCKRILTGGYAKLLKGLEQDGFIFDSNLVLEGMRIIASKNAGDVK